MRWQRPGSCSYRDQSLCRSASPGSSREVVGANSTAPDPATYGTAVAQRLLPDVLPYRTGTTASFGFVEHNGRALGDDAPEVMFSLVMNAGISTGLKPRQFADTRGGQFPYVVAELAKVK
ncbi:MAG: hypothetical protein ACLQUY_07275 [Ktedonobacterales bacterium]